MTTPKRLLDDPHAPLGLRADLRNAQRAADDYDPAAKLASLRAAIAAAGLAGGVAAGGAGAVVSNAGAGGEAVLGASGVSPLLSKLSLHATGWLAKGAVIAALGGAGVAYVALAPRAAEGLRRREQSPGAQCSEAEAAVSALAEARVMDDDEPHAMDEQAPRIAPEDAPRARPGHVAPRRALTSAPEGELAQLLRVRALLASDPAAAREAARRLAHDYPSGTLHGLGHRAAFTRAAQAFLRKHPDSPMRPRLEALLAP